MTCVVVQLPHYASSLSVYQQEVETPAPAPAIASHSGVTSKVSAWLQQTHDIDSTSNGQNHLWARVIFPHIVNCQRHQKAKMETLTCFSLSVNIFYVFVCTITIYPNPLWVRPGSLSGGAGRIGPAHPASPLAGRRPANHKHRPGDADQYAGESS